jgi:molecular chaperone DnaK
MEQGGVENIKKATEALTSASHKLAEVMYQNAGANAAGGGAEANAGPDAKASETGSGKADDVIDAEVVDEQK